MSEKLVLMDLEEKMLRYDAAVLLRKMADSLAQGEIVSETGTAAIAGDVKVECKAKLKAKEGASKGSIEIEISWSAPQA